MNKYLITGGEGLVGRALVRKLKDTNNQVFFTTRKEVDLFDFNQTIKYFKEISPTHLINAAAKVGGIKTNNDKPADFIFENLQIQNNVIKAAAELKINKFIFLGSSCIYPRDAKQPISEDALLTGPLEPTNEWYAIAKIAGLKMTQAYRKQYNLKWISIMPNNVYGPFDNFNPQSAHVIGSLIHKFQNAIEKRLDSVEIWGTGKARREFIYVDDLADAIIFCSKEYDSDQPINIGVGSDIAIEELAKMLKKLTGFTGSLYFNKNYPDGTPVKMVDSSKLTRLGWNSTTSLESGLKQTIDWYRHNRTIAK